MEKTLTLSVIILKGGKFDQKVYKKCRESVSFADEVIEVVHSGISMNFAELRNGAAKKAHGKWLLYIDTDEVVSLKLKEVILESIKLDKYSGFAIPRRNFVLNREMKHCGLWPDFVLRLIRKSSLVKWEGNLHEQPLINGEIHHLTEPLIHYKHDNLNDMLTKTNNWSEVEAKLMFEANHPPMNFFRFFTAGFREFTKRIIIESAFMDGTRGLIYGIYQVYSRLISYSKLWELQLRKGQVK